MNQFFKTLISYISRFEKVIAALFMGIMTVLVIMDVLSREIMNEGIPWAQKAAVYLMIWGGFIGAILVAEKAAHLRPEVADKVWGEKGKVLFVRIQNLTMFLFCAVFSYYGFLYVQESFSFGDKSVVLQVPLWSLQLIIPYTFVSMGLRNIFFFINPEEQLKFKKEFS
jgi:C4-dicarboxylate transporter DctQ subunit